VDLLLRHSRGAERARRLGVLAGSRQRAGARGACGIGDIPLTDASVDVVISNCVINLSADKRRVLAEAARVLRAGGRFAVSEIIADEDMDAATRADTEQWTGCIAGALTRAEFEQAFAESGFQDLEIRETHRVHEHATSAIVRARKPNES
jgi:arsenite methyltransferase